MRRALLLVVVLGLTVGLSIAAMAGEAKYTFYFVSHIGPADPNMLWLTKSIDAIKKVLPVEVIYSAPEVFSIEKQRELLEAAIAAKPDGLIVPITDPVALEEPLRRAIAQGIPVVASNIEDPRPEPEKIPYLTYVGGDEYQTGWKMAEYVLGYFAEQNKQIRKVVVGIGHVGHVGAERRAQGMMDRMAQENIPVLKVALTEEPSKIYEVARSTLEANPDVDVFWVVTMLATPFVRKAIVDLGLQNQVALATVDESPMAIEGILKGYVIATHSQQFYLQGWLPVMWLYIYKEYGYVPPSRELVGPVIIDRSTAEGWKKRLIDIFGEEQYYKLAGWEE
jgi:simple sugar transport system substrate-binding protein|uniref:Periplasmic binding protein domain-containing protein n=1 Tax=Candidatus Caldatribacterium californiense TaxID=1454726 RepID=A0A7V3YFA9_9BACT